MSDETKAMEQWCDDGGQCEEVEGPLSDNVVQNIIDWENGDMDPRHEAPFFQRLVDTGLIWQLQGIYGRTAQRLINAGLVRLNGGAK